MTSDAIASTERDVSMYCPIELVVIPSGLLLHEITGASAGDTSQSGEEDLKRRTTTVEPVMQCGVYLRSLCVCVCGGEGCLF